MTRALPAIPEQNNIGLLRLLFAAIVVGAHAFALSLNPALGLLRDYANSELAVQGFFVLSGFLVVMSCEKSRGLRDYTAKRVRRIYPAYASVILLCAFAGALLTTLPLSDYFGRDWTKYIFFNLTFLNFHAPNLPGVFANNPLQAVDGALWTIKVEVCFYLAVPILLLFFRTRFRPFWLALFYVAGQAFAWECRRLAVSTSHDYFLEIGRQLPGQLAFFIAGAALYYYHDLALRHAKALLLAGIIFCAFTYVTHLDFFYPAGLAILVMAIAFAPYFGNSERFGDLSYGLYIWHFPILQTLVALGFFAVNPWGAAAGALALALIAAFLSWHLIEKRWLRKTSHYRVVDKSSPND